MSKVEQKLRDLPMRVCWSQQAVSKAKESGKNTEIPQRALRLAYAGVRDHCEKHGLRLPNDIPEAENNS